MCPGDVVLRMRKVMVILWSWFVCFGTNIGIV